MDTKCVVCGTPSGLRIYRDTEHLVCAAHALLSPGEIGIIVSLKGDPVPGQHVAQEGRALRKDKAPAELVPLTGRSAGGYARAKALTPTQRSEMARNAANARHGGTAKPKKPGKDHRARMEREIQAAIEKYSRAIEPSMKQAGMHLQNVRVTAGFSIATFTGKNGAGKQVTEGECYLSNYTLQVAATERDK